MWSLEPDRIEAGIDEAGRGCLSGPVYAAAVVWPKEDSDAGIRLKADPRIKLVRDSKTLSVAQRAKARAFVEAEAIAWGIGVAEANEIDATNILHASMLAMRRALDALMRSNKSTIDYLLVDGDRFHGYASPANDDHDLVPFACIVDGDDKFLPIAAASILAKTHRDEHVVQVLHPRFPGYGWDKNKGYGTADHIQAIRRLGPSPEHRLTFRLGGNASNASNTSNA